MNPTQRTLKYMNAQDETIRHLREIEDTLRRVMAWFDTQCPSACPDNALHERIRNVLIRANLRTAEMERVSRTQDDLRPGGAS